MIERKATRPKSSTKNTYFGIARVLGSFLCPNFYITRKKKRITPYHTHTVFSPAIVWEYECRFFLQTPSQRLLPRARPGKKFRAFSLGTGIGDVDSDSSSDVSDERKPYNRGRVLKGGSIVPAVLNNIYEPFTLCTLCVVSKLLSYAPDRVRRSPGDPVTRRPRREFKFGSMDPSCATYTLGARSRATSTKKAMHLCSSKSASMFARQKSNTVMMA